MKMMADTTTIAFSLTLLMTLGIGYLMFLGHALAFTTILVLAGGAKLAALSFRSLWGQPAR